MENQYCKLSWPRSDIALITLNRPEKLNAINVEMLQQWRHALESLLGHQTLRCVLITGEGRAFSSGADIKSTIDVARTHNGDLGSILSAYYNPVISMLRDLPCPVISVVNGLAVGVGFSFALHGDIIIASDNAYFWANFSKIGLAADGGISYLLPRSIGYHRAITYTLLNEKISALDAKAIGIVHKVVSQEALMSTAILIAEQITQRSKIANHEIKKLYSQSLESAFEEQLQAESASQAKAGFSKEAREAIQAFLKK